MVFDTLKIALTTAPVLEYPDFTKEFILETDALLKGLCAALSQQDTTGKVSVIAYMSQTWRPSEQYMQYYSSAKLELLALKWAVIEIFWDYLLESKFTAYTKNNFLAYIQTSKLGASQICWLSELALFVFNIQYWLGKTNKAADTLSQCPVNSDFVIESTSDNDGEDPVILSHSTISNTIKSVLEDIKIP